MTTKDNGTGYCKNCGVEFKKKIPWQAYCGKKCGADFWHKRAAKLYTPRKKEWANELRGCAVCGSEFTPKSNNQKYCSGECSKLAVVNLSRDKFFIFERDNFKCVYCGRTSVEDGIKLHLDHIHPKSKGGEDKAMNLVTACQDCNLSKSNNLVKIESSILQIVAQRNQSSGIDPETVIKQGGKTTLGLDTMNLSDTLEGHNLARGGF